MSTVTKTRPPVKGAAAGRKFWADIGATKTAEDSDGTLHLVGYANTWITDRDGESVAKDAFDGSWDDYRSKNPMLLYQHNPNWPIGNVSDGGVDSTGLGVQAVVPPPAAGEIPEVVTAYQKIRAGVLRTFSIGGFMQKTVKEGRPVISKIDLFEISVVSVPANPDSIFVAAQKALGGESMTVLSDAARAQMEQLLGFRPLTDGELLAMTADEVDDHWAGLSALFESIHGTPPPPRGAWSKIHRARDAGLSPLVYAPAARKIAGAFYLPGDEIVDADEKAAVDGTLTDAQRKKLSIAHRHIQDVLMAHGENAAAVEGAPVDTPAGATAGPSSMSAARSKARDEGSYRAIQDAIRAALADALPDDEGDWDRYCFVEDFGEDWVVYYWDGHTYRRSYSRGPGGAVSLGDDDPVEVRPVTTYVELAIEFDHAGTPFVDAGAKGALPVRQLPIAPKNTAWDAAAAEKRVREWSGGGDQPSAKYAQAFLWRDGDGANYSEYRFPVADVIDGKLQYVAKAVYAAAAVVQGGRGGASDAVASAVKPKLETLYGKLAAEFDDEEIEAPWAADPDDE